MSLSMLLKPTLRSAASTCREQTCEMEGMSAQYLLSGSPTRSPTIWTKTSPVGTPSNVLHIARTTSGRNSPRCSRLKRMAPEVRCAAKPRGSRPGAQAKTAMPLCTPRQVRNCLCERAAAMNCPAQQEGKSAARRAASSAVKPAVMVPSGAGPGGGPGSVEGSKSAAAPLSTAAAAGAPAPLRARASPVSASPVWAPRSSASLPTSASSSASPGSSSAGAQLAEAGPSAAPPSAAPPRRFRRPAPLSHCSAIGEGAGRVGRPKEAPKHTS
mmetsp:Transcript_90359/g.269600  ORF Transcript_90359/g.269600 Transcript_90359/m.269600 type:complete len:270 (+) Transcript_90359:561-1370(+)